jgi:molybdopterin-guanine dinucleotide biosynthesis protein
MSSAINSNRPTIIGIGGLTSEVGKTTLLCELLSYFPGWEAIKTTRGHYRSCGKDPHTCCVSELLSDEPTVHSGYELTFCPGKDTGRYWEAGATNVHWLIGTDDQIEAGITQALNRVEAAGVFVEGNSFTESLKPDFFVMVVRSDQLKMKPTARRALKHASAIYVSTDGAGALLPASPPDILADNAADIPVFSVADLPSLIDFLKTKKLAVPLTARL